MGLSCEENLPGEPLAADNVCEGRKKCKDTPNLPIQ